MAKEEGVSYCISLLVSLTMASSLPAQGVQERLQNDQKELHNILTEAVYNAFIEICGGDRSVDREGLRRLVRGSISFPNKMSNSSDGKPHDVEIKAALAFYHGRRKRKRESIAVELTSDLGLTRQVSSPLMLSELICSIIGQSWDVRPSPSGILYLVTLNRAMALRSSGKLPCPQCVKWCKGMSFSFLLVTISLWFWNC